MKPYNISRESSFFGLYGSAICFSKRWKIGGWNSLGYIKNGTSILEKPYNWWRSNFIGLHMSSEATRIPSFVQIWDGHVKKFVEMIWNDPLLKFPKDEWEKQVLCTWCQCWPGSSCSNEEQEQERLSGLDVSLSSSIDPSLKSSILSLIHCCLL